MSRDLVLLTLARSLADLGCGAAIGFALSGQPLTAGAALVAAVVALPVGARLAEKKGRRPRTAGQLLSLAAAGAALLPRSAPIALALAAAAAAIAGALLLRERADRTKDRPRSTVTILGLGGGAAVAHAAPLGPTRAAMGLAALAFGGAFAAMGAALFVGPGRPPPRATDVAVFLGLGAATVALLSFPP